jgi:hypothetical protein
LYCPSTLLTWWVPCRHRPGAASGPRRLAALPGPWPAPSPDPGACRDRRRRQPRLQPARSRAAVGAGGPVARPIGIAPRHGPAGPCVALAVPMFAGPPARGSRRAHRRRPDARTGPAPRRCGGSSSPAPPPAGEAPPPSRRSPPGWPASPSSRTDRLARRRPTPETDRPESRRSSPDRTRTPAPSPARTHAPSSAQGTGCSLPPPDRRR